jgi:hypothetical protein
VGEDAVSVHDPACPIFFLRVLLLLMVQGVCETGGFISVKDHEPGCPARRMASADEITGLYAASSLSRFHHTDVHSSL